MQVHQQAQADKAKIMTLTNEVEKLRAQVEDVPKLQRALHREKLLNAKFKRKGENASTPRNGTGAAHAPARLQQQQAQGLEGGAGESEVVARMGAHSARGSNGVSPYVPHGGGGDDDYEGAKGIGSSRTLASSAGTGMGGLGYGFTRERRGSDSESDFDSTPRSARSSSSRGGAGPRAGGGRNRGVVDAALLDGSDAPDWLRD